MRELALKTLRKLDWLFVIVLTAIMMAVMMAFKSHLFLTDDNYTQFFPIIDKVYESFITKGGKDSGREIYVAMHSSIATMYVIMCKCI